MAAGQSSSVEPNGNPQTARSCCSKLTGDAGIKREMSGVVRTRGKFVDHQAPTWFDEKFDAENADDIERFEHSARNFTRLTSDCISHSGRCNGDV